MSAATAASASMICCTANSAPKAELVKPGSSESIQTTAATLTATPWKTSASAAPEKVHPVPGKQEADDRPNDESDEPARCEGRRVEKERARHPAPGGRPLPAAQDKRREPWQEDHEEERQKQRAERSRAAETSASRPRPSVRRSFLDQGEEHRPERRRAPENTNPASPPRAPARGERTMLPASRIAAAVATGRSAFGWRWEKAFRRPVACSWGRSVARLWPCRHPARPRAASSGFAGARGYRRRSPSGHAGECARHRNT